MKSWMIAVVAASLVTSAFAYDDLESLMKDMQGKQADVLKAYIAEHPKAEDVEQAERMLTYALMGSDRKEEAAKLLEKKYEALLANKKDVELRELVGSCIMPLLAAYYDAGKKDKVKETIARVGKDYGDNANIDQIKRAMKSFEAKLSQPAEGDAMAIKFKAIDGREVDLAAMTNKLVLIDFWATWCGPCVQELPNVKAAYDKFHDKGFEVIGISLDREKENLEKFVKEKDIKWAQCLNGEGEDTFAGKYGVSSIPTTFLIGKDGKIVATGLRGPALGKKLAELLK